MDNDFNENQVKEFLEKICLDPQFSKSNRYTQLLRFLVEQSLLNAHLKEQTIGMALFKKGYNPIKDDGKVRVYMFNLRKKLNAYYSDAGAKDVIVFSLEKGSYNLRFTDSYNGISEGVKENGVEGSIKKEGTTDKMNPYKISTGLLVIGMLVFYMFNSDSFFAKDVYCWESFLTKDANNTFVLADHVIMRNSYGDQGILYTDKDVNSSTDYIAFQKKYGKDSLQLADYTFFTKGIPFSLIKLTKFFTNHEVDVLPKPESEFSYDVIKRGNIVFIGQQKTMSLSKEIFLKNTKMFDYSSNSFHAKTNEGVKHYRAEYGENILVEYAMVSYIPLTNGSKALYFVSDHDIGVMATVDLFTNLDKLETFYKKLPSKDAHFNALFKVEGLNRLDVNCELVELEVVQE